MSKKFKFVIMLIIIWILVLCYFIRKPNENFELKTIRSDKELYRIYNGNNADTPVKDVAIGILGMPFSYLFINSAGFNSATSARSSVDSYSESLMYDSQINEMSGISENVKSTKDYSKTNVQVENVDEADITKTDGDYIYSISEDNVIITNAKNPEQIKVEAKIGSGDENIPEDLVLYDDKLVVISEDDSHIYSWNSHTIVKIYDITKKANPQLVKSYELYEPYYTSRCINNMLYVISSGDLVKDKDDDKRVERTYLEDDSEKEIELGSIKYLKDLKTDEQTLIAVMDLDNVRKNVEVSSYLMDVSNAYVSEKNIYLLDQKYEDGDDKIQIGKLFGSKGIVGFRNYIYDDYYDYSSDPNTEIYKFSIESNGKVVYNTKNKIEGKTINQYSMDEKDGHFRMALYDDNGARVVIFDQNLKKIGSSNYVAEGERMYSSRFMGDKAYLVTYKTIDPLFVIDLSNERNPKVLGELKIPGYSTYLHPYDENHLIGIGMETKENISKNSSGKVINTTARIVGMKMALFDVSDVNKPVQMSETIIGDSKTTSAILTNPKALLFSKEKQLIAIPVNNYDEDFELEEDDDYEGIISSYKNYDKSYIAEGYWVYNINLEDGFNLKGTITHDVFKRKNDYYYNSTSKLLRGLYIDDNLYTVSENAVKVNNLETMDLVGELKIE